jgi:simple sugar transport system ATP-binding protein
MASTEFAEETRASASEHEVEGRAGSAAVGAFLEVVGVHKRFAGVHALRGVSLTIRPGEVYHLLGENGCGKSTLIKIISGVQPPDEGELRINGVRFAALSSLDSLTAGIETVYQDLSLLPNLSVAENIGLTEQLVANRGRLSRGLDRRKLAQTAARALAMVGLPDAAGFQRALVESLPIATRQLIAIARAIATNARMVIMDEPTTALTKREVDNLIAVVRKLQSNGVAVLFVSHKLDECYAIGGEVIVFRDGQKVAQGPIAGFDKAELARLMTGRDIATQRYRTTPANGPELLKVEGLGRRGAFSDVDFVLGRGEILGVTGLLDSGRNELAHALAGVAPADSGSIALDGEVVVLQQPGDAIALGIGYVPEDRLGEGLFLDKSIQENVVSVVISKLRGRLGLLEPQRGQALAETIVRDLQIATPDVLRPVQSLSGGNQQRVLIGRWLTIKPRLLILHGPTVGVDVGSKDIIYRLVQRLAEEGLSVILVSDDLPELLQNCDRILLMKKGRLVSQFDARQLDESTLYRALLSETSPN